MGIDWPKQGSSDPEKLMAGIIEILDSASAAGLNAIFLQVRPCGDAIYPSETWPWSAWLTGTQGKAPDGGFDPLSAWLEACRERGLRLYAWLNPFRVGAPSIQAYAEKAIPLTHADLVMDLGEPGYLWLDPGRAESQQILIDAVQELIKKYPIDGIVLDDYFYPYREQYPALAEIPDDESFHRAMREAERDAPASIPPDRARWRRENIDCFVQRLGKAVHEAAPDLPFGISPFGIWRPDPERGIRGKDAYAELWTDSRKWLAEGWVDILCPQLYWPIHRPAQSFPILLERWNGWNARGRVLAPAIRLAQGGFEGQALEQEIAGQILIERAMRRSGGGTVLYSARSLGLAGSLEPLFGTPALIPPMDWLGGEPPPQPITSLSPNSDGSLYLSWEAASAREILLRTRREGGPWTLSIHPAARGGAPIGPGISEILISAVDRAGREGKASTIRLSGPMVVLSAAVEEALP